MIIAGLDLSLTSTGVAIIRDGEVILERVQPRKLYGHERLENLLDRILTPGVLEASLVAVEGPSYGSKGGHEHERGGLWWMVAHGLWQHGTPYAVITPSQLKKYATGSGNAGKDQVLAATVRRYPDVAIDGNDVADALVLAAMAADHAGQPLTGMPGVNRTTLTSVSWPAS